MTALSDDARELKRLKEIVDAATHALADAKDEFEEAQRRFFERMQDEGVGSVKVDGTNFVPSVTVYGQVQDREAFIAWAKAYDESLLEPKERKALVNELVRDAIETGAELPPGLGFYTKEYVSQRVAS